MTSKSALWLVEHLPEKTGPQSKSSFLMKSEASLKKLEEGKSHVKKSPEKDRLVFLSLGVSAFLGGTSGPHPTGKGKEVAGGLVVNLSHPDAKLFKSISTAGDNNLIAGFNFSVGITLGTFKGPMQDFFGASTEHMATAEFSGGTIETDSDSEGAFSGYGVGIGLGTASFDVQTEEI